MRISVGRSPEDLKHFDPVEVTFEKLSEIIVAQNYSLSLFRDGVRRKANFLETNFIGLDFDGGYSLDQAKQDFSEYWHIIAPTKSHGTEKNGVIADRFRVILLLDSPITDCETFETTWFELFKLYPHADKACKDASRFFYPSKEILAVKRKGKKVVPKSPVVETELDKALNVSPSSDLKGKLSNATTRFMFEGAPKGSRHDALFKAAVDYKEQGYSEQEFVRDLELMVQRCNGITWPSDNHKQTVRDVFDNREPKYEPRIQEKAFKLNRLGDLYKTDVKLEWLVDRLLTVGGVSLMSSDPKAGKSTLVRQLIRDVLFGSTFLGRKCRQGPVHYYAIEEQIEVVNASFKRLKLNGDEDLFIHVGDPLTENKFEDFREILMDRKPVLAVIDTMFDFLDVESENSYKEVKRELRKLRRVARDSRTHILLVHHNSKAQKDDKRRGNRGILGSQAIAGGMDTIMVLEVDGKERYIKSTGREIIQWSNRELVWHEQDNTYTLGPEHGDMEF
jgi:hypothetical protein